MEGKQKFQKENKNFRRKPKILEGNQNINFGRKAKILEGNQKFWKENKIKFWKETKKIGIEILTPLGHHNGMIFIL